MTRLVYGLFYFSVGLSLLASGSFAAAGAFLFQILGLLALLLCLLRAHRHETPFYTLPGSAFLLLGCAFIVAQLFPLPPVALKHASPQAWAIYAETVWVLQPGAWMPLSLDPRATLVWLSTLLTGLAIYTLSVQLLSERQRLRQAAAGFVLAVAAFALLVLLRRGGLDDSGIGSGPLMLALPLAVALTLASRKAITSATLQEKLADIVKYPRDHPHILNGLLVALIGLSLVAKGGAGGVFSVTLALGLFGLVILARRHSFHRALAVLALALGLGGSLWLTGMADGPESDRVALSMARLPEGQASSISHDFPLFGTGMGTIDLVRRRYPDASPAAGREMPPASVLLAEGGLVGALLFAGFVLAVIVQTFRAYRLRRSRTAAYLYLGSLAGLLAFLGLGLTHARGFGVPDGVTFFAAVGLMVVSANVRHREGKAESALKQVSRPVLSWGTLALVVVLVASLVLHTGWFLSHAMMADLSVDLENEGDQKLLKAMTERASWINPLESSFRYARGNACLALGDAETARREFAAALRLNPAASDLAQGIGLVLNSLADYGPAEQFLAAGVAGDPKNPERHERYAAWLFGQGRQEDGLDQVSRAMTQNPEHTERFLRMMAGLKLDPETMGLAVPRKFLPLKAYGDYLQAAGREGEAEKVYRQALQSAVSSDVESKGFFQQRYQDCLAQKRFEEALEVVQAAIQIFPDDVPFREVTADLYLRLGITYRAVEELQKILLLQPDNHKARRNLALLTRTE